MTTIDRVVAKLKEIMEQNGHISPTVNTVYDTLVFFVPQFVDTSTKQYECIRRIIIMRIRDNYDKKESLEILLTNIIAEIAKECK